MDELYSFMVLSGEPERIYMAFITAIGIVTLGGKVYMFFTMDGLKGATRQVDDIALPNAKPLRYYVDNLMGLGGGDVELAACALGASVKAVSKEELLPGVKVSGIVEFSTKSSVSKATFVF